MGDAVTVFGAAVIIVADMVKARELRFVRHDYLPDGYSMVEDPREQWQQRTRAEWEGRSQRPRGPEAVTDAERRAGERLRYLMNTGKPWPTPKESGVVVPKTARCRDCRVRGTQLTDPNDWVSCWGRNAICVSCCRKGFIESNKVHRTPDPVRKMARAARAIKTPGEVRAVGRRNKSIERVRKCRDLKKNPKTGSGLPTNPLDVPPHVPRKRPSRAKQASFFDDDLLREPRRIRK